LAKHYSGIHLVSLIYSFFEDIHEDIHLDLDRYHYPVHASIYSTCLAGNGAYCLQHHEHRTPFVCVRRTIKQIESVCARRTIEWIESGTNSQPDQTDQLLRVL
jgi:hypothetical protein